MSSNNLTPPAKPDLSLVVTAYNEAEVIAFTVGKLIDAFRAAGIQLQLVAVDNGSHDGTGEIMRSLSERYPEVTPVRVPVNSGYGNGVLRGLPHCTADWVGTIPADGQVDAEDVVRLFEAARVTNGRILAKVRRRFRMDGLKRKIVSVAYNFFFRAMWPTLRTLDVNGNPKILRREYIDGMNLQSTRWFLDPEMTVKAHYIGLRILELNVFARMRGTGLSNVRAGTCLEFFTELLRLRIAGRRRVLSGMRMTEAVPVDVEPSQGKA